MNTLDGVNAGKAPSGPQDHLGADRLPKESIWTPDNVGAGGRDGRRLEPKPMRSDRLGSLPVDIIVSGPAGLQTEVERRQGWVEADDFRRQHAQNLIGQVLPGLVFLQDDEGGRPVFAHG